MSNCLVLQGKNFIAIGADTASSILIDGKYRRIGTDAKKLYRFGNEIMFCSGRMALVELVTSNIVMKDNKIVLNSLTDFIKSLSIQKADTYDLEVLICGVENNKSYMHQISQYNDFEVKTVTNDTSGCAVYSTGFNAKTMLDTTKKNYGLCKNISDLFIKSFTDISSDEVGGYINMYLVQENQITKCVDSQKVDDVESISVSNDNIHFVIADCLIGDMIIGETLLVANSTGTFIVDKDGIIVERMKLDMSNADGSRRIVIDPELDSILSVYTNSKQVFYVDTNGNMCMLGNLYVNNNNMYLKVDMTAENIIEVGYGEITGTGNEGEAGSGEGGGANTGNYVEQMWEQVDYGQDIYNGATPIIASGIDSNVDTFNNATEFTQYHFLNYGGEIYHLAYGGYLVKYNEKQQTWNLVTQLSTSHYGNVYYSSFVKTNKEDGNIYIFFTGHDRDWAGLYKYNLDNSLLSQVWSNGEMSSYIDGYFDYGRHYIKDDSFYISAECSNSNTGLLKVSLNSDRTLKSGEYSQWCNGNNCIHEIIPYNNEEYGVISIGQSKVILVKFKNIDSFTYDTLYTFDYTMSYNLRTGGIIADVFNDKIYIVFKNMSIHYEYDIKSDIMKELNAFKLSLYGTAENPKSTYGSVGVTGFSIIASNDKLHMFALGANQCYGADIYTGYYSSGYTVKDLVHIPQYYIRHYEYLDNGKIEINKKFQKLTSGYNFYMSRQCSFTKIGDIIYNIPTFWGMLTGDTYTNSKTANYSTWNMPIYALDTTSTDNDFQIICNSIGVPIVSVINSNSTSKIYFFAGTDATYLQYYDLETQTIGSVFTDESGNRVASNLGWSLFSYLDENEQILYEMGTDFVRLDLTTNTVLEKTSLGITVHSNVEIINDEFYFVSLTSDGSKSKLYKITKSGVLSAVTTMQEADDIGSNIGYSIVYYNNKIHMYYATNGMLMRRRYEYSFDTGEVDIYDDTFQDCGMYIYDNGLGSNCTCHLPAIATSTGIHYFTGTTYDFNNKFTNPFNHYLYTESTNENTNKETEWAIGTFDETPNSLSDVCYYNGKFIAGGQAGYRDCFWYSDDLVSWTKTFYDEYASSAPQICTNGNILVSAGTYFYYSTDGISWSKSDSEPTMSPIKKLIYANNMFIACGVYEGLYYSTDGITWNEITISNCTCGSSRQFDNLFYVDGKFIAVGYAPPAYSTDGITWFHYDTYNIPVDTSTIQYCNGHLVGYKFGEDNAIEVYEGSNSDVVSWTLLSSIPTNFNGYTGSRICYANGEYTIAIPSGDNKEPCVISSEDLLNWTTQEQFLGEGVSCSYAQLVYLDNANKLIFLGKYDTLLYSLDCSTTPVIPDVVNPDEDGKIFYITNTGDGYFYGNVYAKDGIFKGDIIARSLTLGEGVTLNTSDISGMDDYVMTDVGLGTESGTYCKIGKDGLLTAKNAIISGQANIGKGYIGGWEIGDNGLKSVGFDDTSITNGIRLDSNGEIRSKGSWYSSVDGSGVEGWFSRLCSGKWIFGYYDSTQSDPFVPPTGTPYSDISVNGIYMCSQDTILNKSSQYLFAVDTTNDTVKITNSAKNSPALEITNNGSGASLKIHSVTQGYENRAFDAQVVSSSETSNVVIFGEGDTDVGDRVIFRCDKSVEVLDEDGNPTGTFNHEPSEQGSVGTALRRWNTGYFNSLYSKDEVSTSDAKLKDVIGELDKQQSLEFINSLTPYEYTFKDSKHKRKHMGFLAQSVKDTVVEKNMGDMAIYEATRVDDDGKEYYFKDEYDENELLWGLKYNEFIAPLVGAVQALTKRVEDLEADNEKLRTRIEKLEDVSE